MPYEEQSGRQGRTEDVVLKAAGVETASTSSPGVEVGDRGTVRVALIITAVSGTTPTLDVTIETSFDNGATDAWRSLGTFAQQSGTTAGVHKDFSGADRWVRSRSVIGGTTPSFTYSIAGEAV